MPVTARPSMACRKSPRWTWPNERTTCSVSANSASREPAPNLALTHRITDTHDDALTQTYTAYNTAAEKKRRIPTLRLLDPRRAHPPLYLGYQSRAALDGKAHHGNVPPMQQRRMAMNYYLIEAIGVLVLVREQACGICSSRNRGARKLMAVGPALRCPSNGFEACCSYVKILRHQCQAI